MYHYYFYCRLLYSLFWFKPSRRRWIFVLRKLPETKPLLVPVRALVHRHRRLRPAFALAVRKRVLEVPGVRLISSDRFSRFIDFGVRHFVVLATGDARFVRLTTFVGLAGHVAARAPVAFLDRFRRRATSSGWHDVEPIAGIPVIIRNVMKALLCIQALAFGYVFVHRPNRIHDGQRRNEEEEEEDDDDAERFLHHHHHHHHHLFTSANIGNFCRCRVCARENARRRFKSLSLSFSLVPPREKKTRAPRTKESSFSEGFRLDLYILLPYINISMN